METFANNAVTTLNGAINNSVTSLVVTSATGYPSTGNFRIQIDSEIMKVTGTSGTTFTVVRAQEGTTAASHTTGSAVSQVLTRQSLLNAVRDPWNMISVLDFGVKGDGVTDDTTALQNAIAALVAGQILIVPAATYIVSGTLTFATSDTRIVAAGNVIFKKTGMSNFDGVRLTGDRIQFVGFSLNGNNVGSANSGIGIYGSYCHVSRCDCYLHKGHGIYLEGAGLGSKGYFNVVDFNHVHDNLNIGIAMHQATDNLVTGNQSVANGDEGITVDNSSWRNRVIGNHVDGNCLTGGAGNISIDLGDLSVIANNEVLSCGGSKPGIIFNNQAGGTGYVTITGNNITDNAGGGVYLKAGVGGNTTRCVVTANNIRNSGTPIKLDAGCNNNVVTSNNIDGGSITNSGSGNSLANNI